MSRAHRRRLTGPIASLGAALALVLAAATTAAGAARASATTAPPSLDARAVALIEASTGQSLYGAGAGGERAIASATKLMTALVTLQHARRSAIFTEPDYYPAPADSQIGLAPGERMSVHDLLIALLLPSADDAAEDLAYNVGRHSVSRFVAMMNAQAVRLGLSHTHYSTPIGLDTPGNYSSAADLLTLTRYLLATEPFVRRVVDLPSAVITIGSRQRRVVNLNTLVGSVPWVNGVKTGHTLDAGYVLVGSGTRGGMTLISAVLGAPSESARETETLALLRWGFRSFRLITPVTAGEVVVRRPVSGHPGLRIGLVAAVGYSHVVARATAIRTVLAVPAELTGPHRAGYVAGQLEVFAGRRRLVRIPLRAARAVPAPPPGLAAALISQPFTLVVIVLVLAAGALFVRRVRIRARRPVSEGQA